MNLWQASIALISLLFFPGFPVFSPVFRRATAFSILLLKECGMSSDNFLHLGPHRQAFACGVEIIATLHDAGDVNKWIENALLRRLRYTVSG